MTMAKKRKPKQELLPAAPSTEQQSLIEVISRAASNPNVDVSKLEKLLEMHTKIVARDAEVAFNNAMNAAQAEISRVAADATNPQTRSKYATYPKLDRVLRPIYIRHGFSLSFDTDPSAPPGFVHVKCYVSHKTGHTRPYSAMIPWTSKGPKGQDVMTDTHAAGSAMAYGQRYILKYIFNVAVGAEDDDGNMGQMLEQINADQVKELEKLLKDSESNTSAYLSYLSKQAKRNISELSEIPMVMFKDAKVALERKLKKVAA